VDTHNKGKGAKSLKGKLPVRLVYKEVFETKSEALKREIEIKNWPRSKKLDLILRA
ncbi:MAG TPA: GIY-YIG nuclease family protein, partial [Patescibacteria group bacterium]|nr:GIY-YIG nuclease family protein [Patescibacteria group bacterium]